jgi:predicted ATPase
MPDLLTLHTARRAASATAEVALARTSRRLSQARLALAATMVALLVMAAGYAMIAAPLAWTLGGLLAGAFVALVVWHDRVEHRRLVAAAHVQVSQAALDRHARRWDALPPAFEPYASTGVPTDADGDADAATADDLDLFGRVSLRQLIGRAATPGGARRVDAWMLAATHRAPDDITARQQAVRELAPRIDHREALLAESFARQTLRHGSAEVVMQWVRGSASPLARAWPAWAALVVPAAALTLVFAERAGVRGGGWWLLLVVAAWALRAVLAAPIARAFAGSDALSGEVRRYASMLARWEGEPFASDLLVSLQARLTSGPIPASQALRSLGRLVDLADLRWSHLPHVFVHSVTAWDVHVAAALERWNARHGAHVPDWFEALAELDALAALASLAHDEPEWTYASFEQDSTVEGHQLSASGLGHPLIAATTRVGNDVEVGPPGTVLVVTGSNMSGKSTLLRAIGLNVVLAQMGAPVCARAMTLPSVRLETSIRVADSLAAGVSYFMAALLRLKHIVVAADEPWRAGQPRVLYLLDEVLQGTNSEERQIAIRHIVRHLVHTPAIGALTTHDLHLVNTPEFQQHARHVHFTEHVEHAEDGPIMHFDYLLRPGPAQSRNALALVRMVGLGDARMVDATNGPFSADDVRERW